LRENSESNGINTQLIEEKRKKGKKNEFETVSVFVEFEINFVEVPNNQPSKCEERNAKINCNWNRNQNRIGLMWINNQPMKRKERKKREMNSKREPVSLKLIFRWSSQESTNGGKEGTAFGKIRGNVLGTEDGEGIGPVPGMGVER
jgi:hypothetical protein